MAPSMPLPTARYFYQQAHSPTSGRHILASFDDDSIVVYQAYRPAIGGFAIEHGYFGGEFSYSRMSWIKPNFLWMMYRSGWGTKEGQEIVVGLRLRRSFFDRLLAGSIPSSWDQDLFAAEGDWSRAVSNSDVRIQWDPDHDPFGGKVKRRALQLGLRSAILEEFGRRELLEVIDMTDFVAEQRDTLERFGVSNLITPIERIYRPSDPEIARRLKLADTN